MLPACKCVTPIDLDKNLVLRKCQPMATTSVPKQWSKYVQPAGGPSVYQRVGLNTFYLCHL